MQSTQNLHDSRLVLSHVPASVLYDWQKGSIQNQNDSFSIPKAVKDPNAIIVILDLSGYTRATQLLMDQAEEKHRNAMESFNASQYVGTLVKYCLDPLLQLVNTFGGDMLNYGGDALFCIWRGSDKSYSSRVSNALQCCIEAAKWVRQHPLLDFDNHLIPLAVHTVIHACEVELLHVGDAHLGRLQCIAYGEEYFRACDLLAIAKQDEIVITQQTLALVEIATFSNVAVRRQNSDYSVLFVDTKSKPVPLPQDAEVIRDQLTSELTSEQLDTISQLYVDPAVFHRPVGTTEIRQATIAFFRLQYVGEKESFLWSLNELLNSSLQVCQPRMASSPLGILRQIALDDKGLSIMLLFGLRPATSENPSLTASCVCLKLLSTIKVQKLPFDASCGIATGRIYSGCISNDSGNRLEHAVLGQAVNLAARFMSLAEVGTILCDQVTSSMLVNATMLVSTERLPEALTIKGFQDAIPVWKVKESVISGSKQSLQSQSIVLLVDAVDFHDPKEDVIWQKHIMSRKENASSPIHTFTIEGSSGAGKSCTASRISTFCFKNGFTVWNVPTFEIEKSTAFSCVRQLLILVHRLFTKNEKFEQMNRTLSDKYPDKQGFELICEVLNISEKHVAVLRNLQKFVVTNVTTSSVQGSTFPSTANGNSHFSPDDILQSATETILLLMNSICNFVDLLIVFDDCQWLDRYSWTILSAIHLQCPKLILICISRPPKEYADPTHQSLYENLAQSPATYHISVGTITYERTKNIVKTKFSQLPVAQLDEMTRRLVEMSSGNAFALDVLLRHIETNLNSNNLSESILSALPKDAKSVFVSQLDSLDPTFQSIVRTAAAIGQMFRLSDILALCDIQDVSFDELQNKILEWDKFGFIEPLDENKWRFKHCLISYQISSLMTKEERNSTLRKIAEYFENVLQQQSQRPLRKPELLPLLSNLYHTLEEKENSYRIDCKLVSLYYRLRQGYECRKLLLELTEDKKRFNLLDSKTRNKFSLIGVQISFLLGDVALTHLFFRPFVEAYGGIRLKKCLLFRVFQLLSAIKDLDKIYKPVRNAGQWPASDDQRTDDEKIRFNVFLKTINSAPELPHDPALTIQVHTSRILSCLYLYNLNESFEQRTENLVGLLGSYYVFDMLENAIHLRDYLGIMTLDPDKPFMKMLQKLDAMSLRQLESLPIGIMTLLHFLGPILSSFEVNFQLGFQISNYIWKLASRHGSFRLQEAGTHFHPSWCRKWIQGALTKDYPLMVHARSIRRICEQQPTFTLNIVDSCAALGNLICFGSEVYHELMQPLKYNEELKSLPNLDLTLADLQFADQFVRSRVIPLNCPKSEILQQYFTSYFLVHFDLVRGAHVSAIDHLERFCTALRRFDGFLQLIYSAMITEILIEFFIVAAYRLRFPDQDETPLPSDLYERANKILLSFISEFHKKSLKNKSKWLCMKILEVMCYQLHAVKSVMQLKTVEGCKDVIPLVEKALAISIRVNSQKGEILFRELCLYMKLGVLPRTGTNGNGKEFDSKTLSECKVHLDRILYLYGQSNALWSPRHIKRIAKLHSVGSP